MQVFHENLQWNHVHDSQECVQEQASFFYAKYIYLEQHTTDCKMSSYIS